MVILFEKIHENPCKNFKMALSRFYESFHSNSYSSSVCCICCPRNDCVEEDCLWCRVCDVSKNLTLMLNDFQ